MSENNKNIWSFGSVIYRGLSYVVCFFTILILYSFLRGIWEGGIEGIYLISILMILIVIFSFLVAEFIYKDFKKMAAYDKRKMLEKQNLLDDVFMKENKE